MDMTQTHPAFDQHEHDHRASIDAAISAAEEICAQHGAQLTKTRRRVLELIWVNRNPVRAYQLLDQLSHERGQVTPPTIYRALDFLLQHRLIHRIESLNAFVGCSHPHETHTGCFLICRACGAAAEIDDARLTQALDDVANSLAFRVERQTVEMRGLCPACTQIDATAAQVGDR